MKESGLLKNTNAFSIITACRRWKKQFVRIEKAAIMAAVNGRRSENRF